MSTLTHVASLECLTRNAADQTTAMLCNRRKFI